MLHIIKNYRELFLGLVEAKFEKGDLQTIADASGDKNVIENSDLASMNADPSKKALMREFYNTLAQNGTDKQSVENKTVAEIARILNLSEQTVTTAKKAQKTLRKEASSNTIVGRNGETYTADQLQKINKPWAKELLGEMRVGKTTKLSTVNGRGVETQSHGVVELTAEKGGKFTKADVYRFFENNPSWQSENGHDAFKNYVAQMGVRMKMVPTNNSHKTKMELVSYPTDKFSKAAVDVIVAKTDSIHWRFKVRKAEAGYTGSNNNINPEQLKGQLLADIRTIDRMDKDYAEFTNMADLYLNQGKRFRYGTGIVGGFQKLFGINKPEPIKAMISKINGNGANINAQFKTFLAARGNIPYNRSVASNLGKIVLTGAMGGLYMGDALVGRYATQMGVNGGEMAEFMDWARQGGKGKFKPTGRRTISNMMESTVDKAANLSGSLDQREKNQIISETSKSMSTYIKNKLTPQLQLINAGRINFFGRMNVFGSRSKNYKWTLSNLQQAYQLADRGDVKGSLRKVNIVEDHLTKVYGLTVKEHGKAKADRMSIALVDCIKELSDAREKWANDMSRALNGEFTHVVSVEEFSTVEKTNLNPKVVKEAKRIGGKNWRQPEYWNQAADTVLGHDRKIGGQGKEETSTATKKYVTKKTMTNTPGYDAADCAVGSGVGCAIPIIIPTSLVKGNNKGGGDQPSTQPGTGPGTPIKPSTLPGTGTPVVTPPAPVVAPVHAPVEEVITKITF